MTLIERLEAAEAGDTTLSYLVTQESLGDKTWMDRNHGRPVTTSLDAALALAERVLPGWAWGMTGRGGRNKASVMMEGVGAWEAFAPTPALALCTAILKAKESEK